MLISLELWAHYSTMPRKTRDEAIFLNLLGIEEHLEGTSRKTRYALCSDAVEGARLWSWNFIN